MKEKISGNQQDQTSTGI